MDKENILDGEAPVGISSSSLTKTPPSRPSGTDFRGTMTSANPAHSVMEEMQRATCTHCSYIFKYNPSKISILKCPNCHQNSIVGESSLKEMRQKGVWNICIGLALLMLGIFIVVGTYMAAVVNHGGYYLILFAPFVWAGVCIKNGIGYLCVKQSKPITSVGIQQQYPVII